jgi:uncharacterized membrane protein YphA (DoxX/SURF4 family)
MKFAIIAARVLLGLIFVVLGLNFWLKFISMPPPSGQAAAFIGAMYMSGYLAVVKVIEVVGGLLVLSQRYTAFGLLLLGPVVVNIVLFDLFLTKAFNPASALAAVLSLFLLWTERARYGALVAASK